MNILRRKIIANHFGRTAVAVLSSDTIKQRRSRLIKRIYQFTIFHCHGDMLIFNLLNIVRIKKSGFRIKVIG